MMFLGESLLNYGRVVRPEETIEGLQSVTADDVRRVAGDVFEPSRMTLSVVVPSTQSECAEDWQDSLSAII